MEPFLVAGVVFAPGHFGLPQAGTGFCPCWPALTALLWTPGLCLGEGVRGAPSLQRQPQLKSPPAKSRQRQNWRHCQFLSAGEDAPDSAEKFPRKSECLQSGDQPAELHDGRTRAAPSHRGRTSRGSSWHAPAPRTFPMSPEDFSATAAVGTAWPPVQTLKDAPGTRRDRTGEQNSPSKTVIPVPPREGSGPQRWDPHSCGASLLKKNQECGAAGFAYQTAGLT